MVQETFLAALKGGQSFAGRSAEKSWLVGILKHKIMDYYRKASRETSFTDLEFYSDEESDRFIPDGLFKDGWIHDAGRELGPMEWSSDPGASLDSQAFWKTFHDCSSKMPKNVAAVFTMREVDGVESKEICRTLNISESNLWVMLHRARMALRSDMKLLNSIKMRWVVWVWNHTPNCAEMSRLASISLEQPPSFAQRLKMRLHHLICVWCQRYQKQLQFLHRAAPRMQEEIEAASNRKLSEESKRRMVERLREECRH
jgi:RNA polymerase sigma-70 factor (ECF subfamily)